ncbi:MAG: ribosome biogenesis GTPase Der [Syntrophomonadaceae bacterium]|nr:ribosome biogenesis GTPase Der [Syntrophomonadaceae bacterium]
MSKPVVAIVGRPNVGKSTLFNRLAGMRKAIVEDIPGVTRDRIYEKTEWEGREFIIIDTGGFTTGSEDGLAAEVKKQAQLAMEEADVIVMVVDAREGLVQEDEAIAEILRKSRKPVVLAANKVEDFHKQTQYYEFFSLGLSDPIPISAAHGLNISDLLDEVVANFPEPDEDTPDEGLVTRIAVVGRPNVGKSSLVNAILGEERVIVSDVPGTTRDAIDTPFEYGGNRYILIDTAGIRRKTKISVSTERYSVMRAFKAVDRADVVLIIIDATEGVTEQDQRIAGFVHEQGRASVIVVNKWDLVTKDAKTMTLYDQDIREDLKFMAYAPILYVSALTGQRVHKILELVDFVAEQHYTKVQTSELNRVINEALLLNPPPGAGKKKLKIYYATQVKTGPPTFVLFVNDADLLHFSYLRYLENTLRQAFGFEGSPLRLIPRQRAGKE